MGRSEAVWLFFCQKKTIRYAYGSGELSAMYQKNSSQCYNKIGSPTEFIAHKEEYRCHLM